MGQAPQFSLICFGHCWGPFCSETQENPNGPSCIGIPGQCQEEGKEVLVELLVELLVVIFARPGELLQGRANPALGSRFIPFSLFQS